MEHFIKNIEITNFKSIRHAKIKDCRRVNVFVGPPNVGKSNILEALSGFSYLMKSNSVNPSELLRFKEVVDLYNNGNTLDVSEISTNNGFYLNYYFKSVKSFKIEINSYPAIRDNNIIYIDSESYHSSTYNNGNWEVKSLKALNEKEEPFPDWIIEENLLKVKKYSFKTIFDYKEGEDKSLLAPFGNNINDVIEINQTLRKEIVAYFKAYDQKLLLDKAKSGVRILWFLNDETVFSIPFELIADTLKRLIFYKAAILSNENTVLLFEEPEAHCYEPYILEFTNSIKRDQNNNQFFIVTHSQYVIEELLRDEESRNDTNIYMVGLENNETKIKLLSQKMNKEIYQTGLNVFFNYQSLWNEISEHEAVH